MPNEVIIPQLKDKFFFLEIFFGVKKQSLNLFFIKFNSCNFYSKFPVIP